MLDRNASAASLEYAAPGAAAQSIGTAVEGMVGGRVAAVFANDPVATTNSGWSKTIWDLLQVTGKQYAPRRQAGVPAATPRGVARFVASPPAASPPVYDEYEPEVHGPGFARVEIAVEPGPAFGDLSVLREGRSPGRS